MDVDALVVTDVAVKAGYIGLGTTDDSNANIAYRGSTWSTPTYTGPYQDSLHVSRVVGDTATIKFTGNQFKLVFTGNKNRGKVRVWIDGKVAGTINQYSRSLTWKRVWSSKVLSHKSHTVVLEHRSGAYMDVDAVIVY